MNQQPDQNGQPDHARPRRYLRPIIQAAGFAACILLLAWCVRIVMSEDNREALENLKNAGPGQIIALLALAALGIVLNGLIFWCTIRPVRPIRAADVIATNALATFLSYLPFKISILTRILIHNRRDGVPTLTIGAWFAVVAGLMLLTIAPLGLIFVRPEGWGIGWWPVVLAAIIASNALGLFAARLLRGPTGLQRLRSIGIPESITASTWFGRLHAGADMAADPRAVLIAAAARIADMFAFGLRFWIAAQVIGVPISPSEAVIIGLAYFVAGVISPFGSVGAREAGAIGMAALAGVLAAQSHRDPLITAILLVTVTDAVTSLGGAGFAVAWLRADRLLLRRIQDPPNTPTQPHSGPTA
jgi:hypothetical protein